MFQKEVNLLLRKVGTGWLPPIPDMRDFTEEHPQVQVILERMRLLKNQSGQELPKSIDLRFYCTPIEDQGRLGSCTAQAAAGVIEYFIFRSFHRLCDFSRLFIYKNTRSLMSRTGDTGAWLRNTLGSLVICGAAPERYWPYTDEKPEFDAKPDAFVYSVAENFKTMKYFAHDPLTSMRPQDQVLKSVKEFLAAGVPSMFGFYGFPSFGQSEAPGLIPFPCSDEKAEWGHAVVAVGYDDDRKIVNTKCEEETRGALLIRNSWGENWGSGGYGFLPYKYILRKLALDFWSVLSMEWIDSGEFGI